CNKMYLTKGHCKNHERKCSRNPDNYRDCFTCKGLQERKIDVDGKDSFGVNVQRKGAKVFYCSFIDMYVIPPKAEHKGNAYKLDKMNVPMPKICDAKEEKTFEDFINEIF